MVVPAKHPKMIIFSRKTYGCWVPLFSETSTSPSRDTSSEPRKSGNLFPNGIPGLGGGSLIPTHTRSLQALHLYGMQRLLERWTTLPETNIAHENPPVWCYLPGKMGIFMGYVSFREGTFGHHWKIILSYWWAARTLVIPLCVGTHVGTYRRMWSIVGRTVFFAVFKLQLIGGVQTL